MNHNNNKEHLVVMSEVKLGHNTEHLKISPNKLNLNIDREEAKLECWTELKVKNKFINKRSYHASCIYNNMLFVYGGQDLNVGLYSDFNYIHLTDDLVLSCWEPVQVKGTVTPGPLSRMSSVLDGDKWYLFGGTSSATHNSSDLWCFDFIKSEWTLIKPASSAKPPCLDSHSGCLYKSTQGKSYIVIFGGFVGGTAGEYWNQVVKFDLEAKKWILPYKDNNAIEMRNANGPSPRCGHSAVVYFNDMYVFGGTNGEKRYNDLWKYNLQNDAWTKVNVREGPPPRNGHTSVIYKNQGILTFGGIQDITHERDDLLYFNFNTTQWIILETDKDHSPTGRQSSSRSPDRSTDDKHRGKSPSDISRRSPYKTGTTRVFDSSSPKKAGQFSPNTSAKEGHFAGVSHTELRSSVSPNSKPYQGLSKENEEKRKKLFQARKMHFLKQFDVTDPTEAMEMILKSPTTEAMKNSIIAINYKVNSEAETASPTNNNNTMYRSPSPGHHTQSPGYNSQSPVHHYSQGSPTHTQASSPSRTKKRINNTNTSTFGDLMGDYSLRMKIPINGKLNGRKPCARDGHTSVNLGDKMIVFGGDRHKMCFNDVYVLDVNQMMHHVSASDKEAV